MINSIAQIGKLQWETLGYHDRQEDLLKVFAEDPSDKGKYQHAVVIQFENAGKLHYSGVKVKEYDSQDIYRYMYKPGSPNGSDYSPTAKITEPSKTLEKKILRRIKEVSALKEGVTEEQINLVKDILCVLEENYEKILNDIEEIYGKRGKNPKLILTISIIQNDDEFLPGDLEIFQKAFVQDVLRNFYYRKTGNIDTRVKSSVCSICYKTEVETYGLASPFTFYTIDKPGYIAGGFLNSMVSYNYPVCKSCAIWLLMGKKYLDEHLTFNAFGKTFYIIPKVINSKLLSNVLAQLDKLNDSNTFSQFRERYLKREDMIFKHASRVDEDCSFNFVFFKEDNNSFRILLDLNDILPSRLKTIFQALQEINNTDFFHKFPIGSETETSILINFSWLRDVMESAGTDRYFLELFGSIISDKKIDYDFLMKFVYQELINSFNETGNMGYRLYTILSYGFLSLLHNLHLLNYSRKGEWQMNLPSINIYDIRDYNSRREVFEAFFNDHAGFFDKTEKAVFMIGYLTQRLLNIQMKRYDGNTPFRARLKGLKLNKKDIHRLFHEI